MCQIRCQRDNKQDVITFYFLNIDVFPGAESSGNQPNSKS